MLTRVEILEEYTKCLKDPKYPIMNFLQTYDQTQGGFVPFKLFEKQQEIIDCYEKYRFNLVAKPRQAGISTTSQAYMSVKASYASSSSPVTLLIIANKLTMAKKFLKGIRGYISQLPRWTFGEEYYGSKENLAKTVFLTDSTTELILPNGSTIVAVATSGDALRGYTPTHLIFDEAAFIDNGEEVYSAAMSSCATGGKAMLISTPNGKDPLYFQTYDKASKVKQENRLDTTYNIIHMRWYEDPRYNKDLSWIKYDDDGEISERIMEVEFDPEMYQGMLKDGYKATSSWYEGMCETLHNNPRKIAQELDVSFLGSGGNVIADADIAFQVLHNVEDPKYTDGRESEFWIWQEPQEGHQYGMGVDVSRGDGEDSSTIVIVDLQTMEEVMEWQGKIAPDLLGEIVYKYGNLYKAYTVVDVAGGMGVATVLKLIELEYEYLHYEDPNGKKILNSKASQLQFFTKDNKIPGFNANGVRLPMIAHLEFMIRSNGIKVKSVRLTSEMETFIYKNGRPDHQEGYHDDLLMALAMILWVMEHSFKKLEKLSSQNKAILSSWVVGSGNAKEMEAAEYDTGYVSKANRNKKSLPKPNLHPSIRNSVQDPNGDYLWLFSGTR
tara:strand:+ start:22037 stop:23863 length:1827 start_codon:yes stop_codon:yes gene_type:complete